MCDSEEWRRNGVLPSRLKQELSDLAEALVQGRDIAADAVLAKHDTWAQGLKKQYTFTKENALEILLQETGKVFAAVLEDAGVFKYNEAGKQQFLAFADYVNNL